MRQTLIFPPEPFPAAEALETSVQEFETGTGDFELEEEFRRSSPRLQPARGRPVRPPVRPPRAPDRMGGPRPQSPRPPRRPRPPRSPWPVVTREPYLAVTEPVPAIPAPEGSEYVRWVQDCLNRVMSTRLPVDGVMTPATRSVISSFQRREKLPVSGIMGPDTEEALKAACKAQVPQATDREPQSELNFEAEISAALRQAGCQAP